MMIKCIESWKLIITYKKFDLVKQINGLERFCASNISHNSLTCGDILRDAIMEILITSLAPIG